MITRLKIPSYTKRSGRKVLFDKEMIELFEEVLFIIFDADEITSENGEWRIRSQQNLQDNGISKKLYNDIFLTIVTKSRNSDTMDIFFIKCINKFKYYRQKLDKQNFDEANDYSVIDDDIFERINIDNIIGQNTIYKNNRTGQTRIYRYERRGQKPNLTRASEKMCSADRKLSISQGRASYCRLKKYKPKTRKANLQSSPQNSPNSSPYPYQSSPIYSFLSSNMTDNSLNNFELHEVFDQLKETEIDPSFPEFQIAANHDDDLYFINEEKINWIEKNPTNQKQIEKLFAEAQNIFEKDNKKINIWRMILFNMLDNDENNLEDLINQFEEFQEISLLLDQAKLNLSELTKENQLQVSLVWDQYILMWKLHNDLSVEQIRKYYNQVFNLK